MYQYLQELNFIEGDVDIFKTEKIYIILLL